MKQLKEIGEQRVYGDCVSPARPLGPEAALVREIEDIGSKIFTTKARKRIWDIDELSTTDWEALENSDIEYSEAQTLLALACEKKNKLHPEYFSVKSGSRITKTSNFL